MRCRSARITWPILDGKGPGLTPVPEAAPSMNLANLPLAQLFRIGLALTWPVALVGLLALGVFVLLLLKR